MFSFKNQMCFQADKIVDEVVNGVQIPITNQEVLLSQMEKCDQQEKTSIKSSNECHLYWKKKFNKNTLYFRIIAVLKLIMKLIFQV